MLRFAVKRLAILKQTAAKLKRDESGAIMVFFAVSLVVLLGLVAISFDMGRINITQTELQSYADNVALAAAGELDGKADSITRATAAAASMISDRQTFGEGDNTLAGVTDYTLTFLSTLPASDADPTTAVTVDPLQAGYVRVDVTEQTVPWVFGAAFFSLSGETPPDIDEVGASAIAGFTRIACDISSMMFCVPPGFNPAAEAGNVIRLRAGGGSGQWGPGNFGFLEPPGGASAIDPNGNCAGFSASAQEWCVLAAQSPRTVCFREEGLDTRPGQAVGRMAAAINTRFDIYEGVLNSYRDHPAFGPAPNTISGYEVSTQGGGETPQCKIDQAASTEPEYTIGLPPDDCFATDDCPGGRFGTGDFAAGYADYVATNYGTAPGWFPPYPTTRWQIYNDEIANSTDGDIAEMSGKQETGAAICNAANRTPDPERRVIIAAGVDCAANEIKGSATGVSVDEWVRVFILQPADSVSKDIFVEVLGGAGSGAAGGGAGFLTEHIQLYR